MKQWIRKMYESSVIRYIFFGGCTTMGNLVSFFILRKLKVVNSKYVFQDKCETLKDHVQPFCKFVSARLVTMVIEDGGVWLLVSVMGLNDMIGKFLTQFIVLILNYVFSKLFRSICQMTPSAYAALPENQARHTMLKYADYDSEKSIFYNE